MNATVTRQSNSALDQFPTLSVTPGISLSDVYHCHGPSLGLNSDMEAAVNQSVPNDGMNYTVQPGDRIVFRERAKARG